MQILGRNVEAVGYNGTPIVNTYVRLKEGDCQKQDDSDYKCLGDCEGSFLLVRYIHRQPISSRGLVRTELKLDSNLPALKGIRNLKELEEIAQTPGFSLRPYKKGKVLYLNNRQVGIYNPCGFSTRPDIWDNEVKLAAQELQARINEAYSIVVMKPLESILDDAALSEQLMNPTVIGIMSACFGKEGRDFVRALQEMAARRN